MSALLIGIAGAAAGSLAGSVFFYNKLNHAKIKVREAESGIDVQLQRRFDLIPRLEQLAEQASMHDSSQLQQLTELAKASVHDPQIPHQARVGNLMHEVMDLLPEEGLAGNAYREFSNQLSQVEKDLEMARRYHNALIRDYNVLCQSFPSAVIATLTGFKPIEFYDSPDTQN